MIDPIKEREHLLKEYGFDFPAKAKYVRHENRIYSIMDFDDGEEISFAWGCGKPSSCALGYACYYSPAERYRLVDIKDIVPNMAAECAGCEQWSGTDCTLVAPDAGCQYSRELEVERSVVNENRP